jgi:hypothetical protein
MDQHIDLWSMTADKLKELREHIDQELNRRVRRPGDPITPQVVAGNKFGYSLDDIKAALSHYGELNWIKEIPYGYMAEFKDCLEAEEACRSQRKIDVRLCDANSSNPLGLE